MTVSSLSARSAEDTLVCVHVEKRASIKDGIKGALQPTDVSTVGVLGTLLFIKTWIMSEVKRVKMYKLEENSG